jgi:hypothetical protein
LLQHQGEDVPEEDHDRLRNNREDERVGQCGPEDGVLRRADEVGGTDELKGLRPGGRVAHAEVDGEEQRHCHEQDDVEPSGREHQRSEYPRALEQQRETAEDRARQLPRDVLNGSASHRGRGSHARHWLGMIGPGRR